MSTLLLALNAKYIHSNIAVRYLQKYAAPFLSQPPQILELTINNRMDFILDEIFRRSPDLLLFSTYIWNVDLVRRLAAEYRKLRPDALIGGGGPEVSYESEAFLRQNPAFDLIVRGEGEETVRHLLAARESGLDWTILPGLTVRSGQAVRTNPPRSALDLASLPFPYEADLSDTVEQIKYYESSRGCPFQCQYCLSSIEKGVRAAPLDKVFADLEIFLRAKARQVKFVDRTFNCNHRHSMAIWRYIKEHDNGITNFHFEIAADILNEEEMGLLATFRPGLAQLEIGVQSTNMQTIHEIDRMMDFDMVTQKVQRVASAENIHQHLDLIAGLPYENLESFKKSFNDVYRLRPQQFQLGFLKVLKGSKMHEKAGEYGIVYHTRPMYEVLSTNWLTYDEVIYLKGIEEMVEVYYNSCQFRCTMLALEAEFDTPFAMYEALAEYYEENRLNGLKHSRMGRFDILHDFILSYVKKEHAPKYEDDLLMDLYLREKSKSRPSWAADLSGYKSEIQEFFRKEAEEKRYLKDYEGYSWKQILNMTHVEVDSKGKWTLFDYKRRDPLTKDAKTYRILERKEEERA